MRDDYLTESWSFTVIRAHGLRLLRPEKSWRPIVTVVVDEHDTHETILGSDGQNTNLKAPFILHDTNIRSTVDIKIWQRSQSKKKGKRRNLVASASVSLCELMKRHVSETKIEIRLSCQSPQKNSISSKGRPQNGAFLTAKISPPSALRCSSPSSSRGDDDVLSDDVMSSAHALSDSLSSHPSPLSEDFHHVQDDTHTDVVEGEKPKKPRIRGYFINSDENDESDDDEGDIDVDFDDSFDTIECEKEMDDSFLDGTTVGVVDTLDDFVHLFPRVLGMAASMAPGIIHTHRQDTVMTTNTDNASITSQMSIAESTLNGFTIYRELRDELDVARTFEDLQREWRTVASYLVGLAAVFATVLGIDSSSTSFNISSEFARRAVVIGCASSGIGSAVDAYFWLRYVGSDVEKFQRMARDVYDSYFFFCVSAKVPALCLSISAVSLMAFLLTVSYNAWPAAVLVMSFAAGLLLSLQFIVFGLDWLARRVAAAARATKRGVVGVFGRMVPGQAPDPAPSK